MPLVMRNGVPTHISVEQYNEELAKHRKEVLGIDEESGKLRHYQVENLGKIWIQGQEFSGMAYQGLSTVNTKTYVEEPTRANDGSIRNINDYDTFVVPRCTVNFRYFNIYDYQRLCEAVQSNEFTVKYYDKQFNIFVEHKMYAEPQEMAKLYNVGTDVFGVLDYEVSFIGTLNDLDEFTITYDANGMGEIKGNPLPYDASIVYNKDSADTDNPQYVAYLDTSPVDLSKRRYFKAIFYENSFTPNVSGSETIALTDTTYWTPHDIYLYSDSQTFNKGDVGYENIYDKDGNKIGRNYYLAVYDVAFLGRPVTDTYYWEKISVSKYVDTNKYSSKKTSQNDLVRGQFVIESDESTKIYEAVFYNASFSGVDPTNTKYWQQLPFGIGVSVKWGNSVVISDPEDLFDTISNVSSDSWTTRSDGGGFTYIAGQSINVFKNMTLYAKWV